MQLGAGAVVGQIERVADRGDTAEQRPLFEQFNLHGRGQPAASLSFLCFARLKGTRTQRIDGHSMALWQKGFWETSANSPESPHREQVVI
jgi:hypothetical protein